MFYFQTMVLIYFSEGKCLFTSSFRLFVPLRYFAASEAAKLKLAESQLA